MSLCYMLHFDRPISPNHKCQHYTGVALKSLSERLTDHAKGRGARLTQVALERGIGWRLVATWEGGRRDERAFKNRKNAPRYCPIYNGQADKQWRENKVIISHKGRQHSIKVLPKWAQETIEDLYRQIAEQRAIIDRLDQRAKAANTEANRQAAELYA